MRHLIVWSFAVAALAAPVLSQELKLPDKAPGQPNASVVKSGRYILDPAHSQVIFTVNHLGYTEYSGMFTNPTGTLTLDRAKPALSKISVTFPIDGVKTSVAPLDTHLKSPDFFDAAKFPTATFVSTQVIARGANATITGNLTIRGITKPVVLKARFIGAGPEFWGDKKMAFGFAATASVKRSDYGMAFGTALVSDKIDLVINAGFEAE